MSVIWKPVSESLPQYDEGVLFVTEDDTLYIGARDHTDNKGEHWVTWDSNDAPEVKNVTHWAECPLTPKEIAKQAAQAGEDS